MAMLVYRRVWENDLGLLTLDLSQNLFLRSVMIFEAGIFVVGSCWRASVRSRQFFFIPMNQMKVPTPIM